MWRINSSLCKKLSSGEKNIKFNSTLFVLLCFFKKRMYQLFWKQGVMVFPIRLPLKNLIMSVKSMLFSRMMSLYNSTNANAMKSTKWPEEIVRADQIVSHTENTSSYTISKDKHINNCFVLESTGKCITVVHHMHNLPINTASVQMDG